MTEMKLLICKEQRSDPKDAAIDNALVPLNKESDVSYLIIYRARNSHLYHTGLHFHIKAPLIHILLIVLSRKVFLDHFRVFYFARGSNTVHLSFNTLQSIGIDTFHRH